MKFNELLIGVLIMYKNIYVPINNSAVSAHLIDEAVCLAKFNSARLRFIHVVDLNEELFKPYSIEFSRLHPVDYDSEALKFAELVKTECSQQEVDAEIQVVKSYHEINKVIINDANNWGADLIMLGCCHKLGSILNVWGNNIIEKISNEINLPVLLVHKHPSHV